MFRNLMAKLWADDAGSVIASEYLMLGTIVSLGGAAGLASMRDSMNSELMEYGNAVQGLSQEYKVAGRYSPNARTGGSAVSDSAPQSRFSNPQGQAAQGYVAPVPYPPSQSP